MIEDVLAAHDLIARAQRPVAIIGGAYWDAETVGVVEQWGEAAGIPLVAAFRRQDAVSATCPVYAGNLGYGPNPALVKRVREADLLIVLGARLGEATTDGYSVITPDHPGQTLIHIHPDPEELNSVYRADLALCSDVHRAVSMLSCRQARLARRIIQAPKPMRSSWPGPNPPRARA